MTPEEKSPGMSERNTGMKSPRPLSMMPRTFGPAKNETEWNLSTCSGRAKEASPPTWRWYRVTSDRLPRATMASRSGWGDAQAPWMKTFIPLRIWTRASAAETLRLLQSSLIGDDSTARSSQGAADAFASSAACPWPSNGQADPRRTGLGLEEVGGGMGVAPAVPTFPGGPKRRGLVTRDQGPDAPSEARAKGGGSVGSER